MSHQHEQVQRLSPVGEQQRIVVLDALRGFALLGIFMVNMITFAMPVAEFLRPNMADKPAEEIAGWAIVNLFFLQKFISLFSLLFGVGLIVQMNRAEAAGRQFVPLYLRRSFLLAIFGLAHAWFIWYGDILFIYACIGVLLLILCRLSARTLLWIAGIIIGILTGLWILLASAAFIYEAVSAQSQSTPTVAVARDNESPAHEATGADVGSEETSSGHEGPALPIEDAVDEEFDAAKVGDEEEENLDHEGADSISESEALLPWEQQFPALAAMREAGYDIYSDEWQEAETRAYKHGPALDAYTFRIITWFFAMLAAIFGYGWHVLAMFCIGAAYMKLGMFSASRIDAQRSIMKWGICMGLLLESAAVAVDFWGMQSDRMSAAVLTAGLHEAGSTALCLGIVGIFCVLAYQSSRPPTLFSPLACTGRLALTNYLMQSVVATGLMYWWGFGWFGEFNRLELIGLVAIIWSAQVVASCLYLQVFTIGPAEWLWRSLTYLRAQKLLRPRR